MSPNPQTQTAKVETQPRLRFPEFQNAGEWVVRTMGSLASFSSGGTPSKDNPKYWNGSIPWVSASSMYDLVIERADHYVTPLAIGNGTRIAKKGAILILVRGSMLFKRVPICIAGVDVAFNQDVKALDLEASIDTGFLLYQLSAFQARFPINETGIGAGKIELDHLKGFELFIPDTHEQHRIASCLSSLDTLITAETQKLETLKTHKRGLMQQLFPREGETQPRLRFPEFQNAGEWDVKRVDEQGSVLAGKALAVDAPGPQRPYLRTKNVLDGAIDLSDVLTMPMSDAEFTRFEILDGDVLLNEGQSLELVGRASIYHGEFGQRCAMQNALLRFRAFQSTSAEFAAQYFRQCQKDGTFANVATKTTSVAHLGSSRFSALKLAWPSAAEQKRIATCLSSLDALITAETQKHEALKTHKKGLMQQLFPSSEESQ